MPAEDAKSVYKKPVFIVGMPRSTATLIQGILCNTGKYFPIPAIFFQGGIRIARRVAGKRSQYKDKSSER